MKLAVFSMLLFLSTTSVAQNLTQVGEDTLDFKKLTIQVVLYSMDYIESEFKHNKYIKPNYLIFNPAGSPGYLEFSDTIRSMYIETVIGSKIFDFYKKKRKSERGYLALRMQKISCIRDFIEVKYFFSVPYYNNRTKILSFGEVSTVRVIVKYKAGFWQIEEFIRDF